MKPRRLHAWAGFARDRARAFGSRGPVEVKHGLAAGMRLDGRAPEAMLSGTYEMPVQESLMAEVSGGDLVFDVGANEGFFTVFLARLVGPEGRVVAFEPSGRNLARLRSNLLLNRVGNVEVCPVALSDRSGRDRLQITRHGGGPSLARSGAVPPDTIRSRRVRTVPLDELTDEFGVPNLVKIDVEGAEELVLSGMNRTLRRAHPTIIVEVDGPRGAAHERNWKGVDELLRASGYQVEHLSPSYAEGSAWAVGHTLARPTRLS